MLLLLSERSAAFRDDTERKREDKPRLGECVCVCVTVLLIELYFVRKIVSLWEHFDMFHVPAE